MNNKCLESGVRIWRLDSWPGAFAVWFRRIMRSGTQLTGKAETQTGKQVVAKRRRGEEERRERTGVNES